MYTFDVVFVVSLNIPHIDTAPRKPGIGRWVLAIFGWLSNIRRTLIFVVGGFLTVWAGFGNVDPLNRNDIPLLGVHRHFA